MLALSGTVKSFAVAVALYLGEIAAASATPHPHDCEGFGPLCFHGAPAPSIGSGVPVALAVGAVVLGMWFLKSRRRS